MRRKKTLSQKIEEYEEEYASRLALGDMTRFMYDDGILDIVLKHHHYGDYVNFDELKRNMNKLLDDLERGL